MGIGCFIPIKENSERVKGKNFRLIKGRKLYEYVIENSILADRFDNIYVDTNSSEIKEYALSRGLSVIDREEWLATNNANGNDLLVHHAKVHTQFDYYFQLFATAPFMTPKTISDCVDILINSREHDSVFTAFKRRGFYWMGRHPINYRPGLLPRSQDMEPIIEETTGLYGIQRDSLIRYHCRIGRNPYMYFVDEIEAIDLNTEMDFRLAKSVERLA